MGFLRGISAAVFVLGLSVFQTGLGWASDELHIDPRGQLEDVYERLAEQDGILNTHAEMIRQEETLAVLAPVIERAARAGDRKAAGL